MKKKSACSLIIAAALGLGTASSSYAVKVGEPAPAFSVKDTKGKMDALKDYSGKYVVLEWNNTGCPFVKKHYDSGNMQKLQKEWTAKGVVWLTVLSSAKGKQGYVSDADAPNFSPGKNAMPTAILRDEKAVIAKAYDAKTTPQMDVIDPKGVLIYQGAIDDKPSTEVSDIAKSKNYVSMALTEAMAGKKVTTSATDPYGCSVKY